MRIIDIHAHLAVKNIYPEKYLTSMLGNSNIDQSKVGQLLAIFLNDKKAEKLINQKKAANIEKSVLLIIDGELGIEKPQLSLEEIFELHYSILKAFPDDFVVFAGVDPRRGKYGVDLFKKSIENYGFRGLKLYPPMGFKMDDDTLFPYYEICEEYSLPVLIHTGPSSYFLHNELADPWDIKSIHHLFPKVSFILAHAGLRLHEARVRKLLDLENVYCDFSGYQVNSNFTSEYIANFFIPNRKKLLYGSDWPLFHLMKPLKDDVSMFIDNCIGAGVPQEILEDIFYNNAKQILKV